MKWIALTIVVLTAGAASAASVADGVTLSVRQYRNANGVRTFVFSGRISSGQPGELVTLVGQDCVGVTGYRALAGTQTVAGGAYEIENPSSQPPYGSFMVNSGTAIRARWKNAESAPYLYRFGLVPYALEPKPGVVAVHVAPMPLVKLAGKPVLLQRFRASAWHPYQHGKLKYKPTLEAGATNHQAVFKVTRGLKLRALVPTATARPCYLAGASKPFTS